MGASVKRTKTAAAAAAVKFKGFPDEYRKATPSGKRRWLASTACRDAIRLGRVRQCDVRDELKQLDKRRRQVERVAPTPDRVDEFEQTGRQFPPRADTPSEQMRRASRVLNPQHEGRHYFPANFLNARGHTYDVVVYENQLLRETMGLEGPRPDHEPDARERRACSTREAFAEIEERGITSVTMCELKTEDRRVLRAQLARYRAGLPTSIMEPARGEPPPVVIGPRRRPENDTPAGPSL